MGGGLWGEQIHVYVWLSPFTVSPFTETARTSLISYAPIQNVFGVKKNKGITL